MAAVHRRHSEPLVVVHLSDVDSDSISRTSGDNDIELVDISQFVLPEGSTACEQAAACLDRLDATTKAFLMKFELLAHYEGRREKSPQSVPRRRIEEIDICRYLVRRGAQ